MREPSSLILQRFFRIAILLFSLTFGIGLYALIGAPVVRLEYSTYFVQSKTTLLHTFHSIQSLFRANDSISSSHKTLFIPVGDRKNTYPLLRASLIERKLQQKEKITVEFQKNGKPLLAYNLLQFLSNNSFSTALENQIPESTYIIEKDTSYSGLFVSPIIDAELLYAAIVPSERTFATALFPLVHPLMSPNEIESYLGLSLYSKKIGGTDARVIVDQSSTPIFIWGTTKNALIVAGNEEVYKNAVRILEKTP